MRAREKEAVKREFATDVLNILDQKFANKSGVTDTIFADLRRQLTSRSKERMSATEVVGRAINRVAPKEGEAVGAFVSIGAGDSLTS